MWDKWDSTYLGGSVRITQGKAKNTSLADQSNGNFMDLDIRWHYPTRNFITGVFNKRKSPKYAKIPRILTVPRAHSCLADTCKFGINFS